MSRTNRSPSPVVVLALVAAFCLAPALETHAGRGHGFDSSGSLSGHSIYLAGHESADDSLHIEPLGGVESAHCVACLTRPPRTLVPAVVTAPARSSLPEALTASPAAGAPSGLASLGPSPRAPPLV